MIYCQYTYAVLLVQGGCTPGARQLHSWCQIAALFWYRYNFTNSGTEYSEESIIRYFNLYHNISQTNNMALYYILLISMNTKSPLVLVVVGEVVERLGYDVLGRFCEDVAIGVAGYYADVGAGTLGLVIIQVVHEQIAVMLADELEAGCHFILVVVAGGEGILPLGVDAAHGIFRAVLLGIDTPAGIGIEHVGYYHAALTRQFPVGGIRLTVEVGVGAEERHLLPCVPEGSFVVGARQARAFEGIYVVSVGGAADVDVRLPDVSACGGVAMLQHVMTL